MLWRHPSWLYGCHGRLVFANISTQPLRPDSNRRDARLTIVQCERYHRACELLVRVQRGMRTLVTCTSSGRGGEREMAQCHEVDRCMRSQICGNSHVRKVQRFRSWRPHQLQAWAIEPPNFSSHTISCVILGQGEPDEVWESRTFTISTKTVMDCIWFVYRVLPQIQSEFDDIHLPHDSDKYWT